MRRIRDTVLIIVMLFVLMPVSVFAQVSPLSDEAGYLNAEQSEQIESFLRDCNSIRDISIEIISETSMSASNVKESAIAALKRCGYDQNGKEGGITLYVAKEQREYQILTRGSAKEITDEQLLNISNGVVLALRNDDYYSAFKTFAYRAKDFIVEKEKSEEPVQEQTSNIARELNEYSNEILIMVIGTLLLPLVIAWIMTKKKTDQMNTARLQQKADSYMKNGSMRMKVMQDIYLYSNTVKRAKPKPQEHNSSSNSSSGSSNNSSGGFGGIGGSF